MCIRFLVSDQINIGFGLYLSLPTFYSGIDEFFIVFMNAEHFL